MSDKMRWRYGDTNPVVAAVDSATVIEIGDLVWHDTDDAKPASAASNVGGWGPTIQSFVRLFLGVAMQRSRSGDTAPIRVATTGVFEFDCPSGVFELGNFVGPSMEEGGGQITNQVVTLIGSANLTIGRLAKREASVVTSVLVDIRSTVMTGGVEGSTPSGV
jgi:hypothetical protein